MNGLAANTHPLPLRLVAHADPPELPLPALTREMGMGSDAAWSEFHRRYYLLLLRYAAMRSAGGEEAVEIVQLAYLRIARHIKPFPDETQLWRWLACVVRCTAVDHQRGLQRRTALMEKFAHWQESQRGAPETFGHDSPEALAREALTKLPAEDAQLLRLKYYEGWSVEQLAGSIGITTKAMENRLTRARQRLRERLAKTP